VQAIATGREKPAKVEIRSGAPALCAFPDDRGSRAGNQDAEVMGADLADPIPVVQPFLY
jgi:hypothetical protein